MLKNIENIRQAAAHKSPIDELMYIYGISPSYSSEGDALIALADAIEREISEKYIELPKDADGVPWTKDDSTFVDDLGDVYMLNKIAWSPVIKQWHLFDQDNRAFLAKKCKHVKPRTVEDVLAEYGEEIWNECNRLGGTWKDCGCDGITENFAEKLREMLGSDVE